MTRFVRLMLVWLMLLAIPFQGIASAAMLACEHDAMAAAPSHAASPVAGHCHDEAQAAATMIHHADADVHDGASHDHDGSCSACAACCMGAVIAPIPAIVAAPAAASLLRVPAVSERPTAVDLALPERPPRLAFA